MVVMQQIARDAGALRLPVAPDAHGAVMDVVAAERDVDRRMEFYAGDLGSTELLHVVDVVDMVVFDRAEHTAHAAYYAGLLTMMYMTATDYVVAYILLEPTVILAAADGISFHLRGALDILVGEEMVVFRIQILTEGYAAALAVGNLTVLYYPAFRPVGADHSVLECGRRGPGGGSLVDLESAEGYESYTCPGREETAAADVDLNLLRIGVFPLEIGIDDSLGAVLLSIPFVNSLLGFP